jgi:hypothetical protein
VRLGGGHLAGRGGAFEVAVGEQRAARGELDAQIRGGAHPDHAGALGPPRQQLEQRPSILLALYSGRDLRDRARDRVATIDDRQQRVERRRAREVVMRDDQLRAGPGRDRRRHLVDDRRVVLDVDPRGVSARDGGGEGRQACRVRPVEAAALRGGADGEDHRSAARLEARAIVGAAVQALLGEQIDARLHQVEGARGSVHLRGVDDRRGPVGDGDQKGTAARSAHEARV